MHVSHWILENEHCLLQIDKAGGCLVDFRLKNQEINPLSFSMRHSSSFHEDFYFRGHFLCLGRWGEPTPGERANGLNKHGEFVRLFWDGTQDGNGLNLSATSQLEGLSLSRQVTISDTSACLKITDHVSNTQRRGRMYQIVQHPTIGNPFLSGNTIVNCNATAGFDYAFEKYKCAVITKWPDMYIGNGSKIKLDKPEFPYNSVFPYIVNPKDEFGWVTAFSPEHHVLLGYIWKRTDYPWINHWLHWNESTSSSDSENPDKETLPKLEFRGLEFGNTGVHKPFNKIISENLLKVLGERTVDFIDAGETHTRTFYTFIHSPPPDFAGVENICLEADKIRIYERTNNVIEIPHTLN